MKALFLDCCDILQNKNGLSRLQLVSDYVGIRARHLIGVGGPDFPVLGFSLVVPSRAMALHLYREIILSQVYAFSCASLNPLIIDCGSNVGMSVLFFKRLFPKAHIIAVEPDPETFGVLQRNISQNGLADVVLHNKAIADRDGTTSFYMNPGNPGDLGMSTIGQGHLPKELVVPAVRLSKLIGKERVDFLKLDIEGSETGVVDELAESGTLLFVDQMVIEYHHHIAGRREALSHILAVLVQNGFGYQLRGPDANFRERESFQVVWIYAYSKGA